MFMCYVSLCLFVRFVVYKVFPHFWQGNCVGECFAEISVFVLGLFITEALFKVEHEHLSSFLYLNEIV